VCASDSSCSPGPAGRWPLPDFRFWLRTSEEGHPGVTKGTRGRALADWPSNRLRVSWFGKEKEIGAVSGNKVMELNSSHMQVT